MREALISAYEMNISTRLKTEVCGNYSCTNDVSTSKFPIYNEKKSNYKPFIAFIQCLTIAIVVSIDAGNGVKLEQWCTSWMHQFKVLLMRGLRERRHETFNRLRIFQVISVAFLAGLLWWHTPTSHIEDRVRYYPFTLSHLHIRKHVITYNLYTRLVK